jgi:hypothetical protein
MGLNDQHSGRDRAHMVDHATNVLEHGERQYHVKLLAVERRIGYVTLPEFHFIDAVEHVEATRDRHEEVVVLDTNHSRSASFTGRTAEFPEI